MAPRPHEDPPEVTALSNNCSGVLQLAADLARATAGRPEIHLRHLIAALLRYEGPAPTRAQEILVQLGRDLHSERTAYLDAILRWGKDDGDAWARALGEAFAVDLRAVQPTWGLPQVFNDRVPGFIPADADFLDASRPALRFAKLACARSVKPPIALGLFGNWGSGKTFFMGLVQSHAKRLTDGEDRDYVRRAAQIEFNAWHYEDTNLWASIAVRVFDGLAAELAPDPAARDHSALEWRRKLNQTIASSQGRKVEATAARDKALVRRAEKQRQLEDKIAQRESSVDETGPDVSVGVTCDLLPWQQGWQRRRPCLVAPARDNPIMDVRLDDAAILDGTGTADVVPVRERIQARLDELEDSVSGARR